MTSKTQSSWCPKLISTKAIHFMCKKKIHSGTDPNLFCESNFCIPKLNWKRTVLPFRTSFRKKYIFSIFSLRNSDVSFDKNLKVEIIKKCKELNSTSLKNNITPAVSMDVENSTYLSVCHGKKHYAAQLNRFIVMCIKETCLMDWGCCDRKINCIHKSIAMWFFKQTEQLSRPWRSQTIEVNKTDTCELMTRTCESSFYPPMDE